MFTSKRLMVIVILSLIILLSGCGLYGPEEAVEIDPPPVTLEVPNDTEISLDTTEVAADELSSTEVNDEQANKKVRLTIYYFDQSDDVVPLTLDIPKVEGIGQQMLKYMTVGGPAEEIIPTGFRPVLPAGTTFTMNVKPEQKLAIIDFSKEFLNYQAKSPAEEKKILDAITWSITGFPTVEQVEIRVNGYILEEMPVWKTPIVGPLSRADGINLELAGNLDISRTTPVTLYFYRTLQDKEYLVPVTRLIPKTDDIAKATLEQLIIGPKPGSNLTSSLLPTTKILSVKVSDNYLVADFDEEILGLDKQLSNQLIDMIVYSLTENTNIPTIQIKIKGETGNIPGILSEPIMRPEKINSIVF
ncbi:hypothetical protein BHF71_06875 [Vulcanibacillus modesticaldus]|uniref:GerMN domain-containing protein n=1 Tax=Vulcanibacillus modesticaldus TaxID=337097 RepID=A0A1D2YWC4_9BACI|nr:GerMN domain-containing protein [Vulcanibacillus modesticaldus]OEF99991.1 hypothetical protein BHF71_06875 [Vulcanibacillus modesticaldus]